MSELLAPSSNLQVADGSPKPTENALSISSGGKCRLRGWLHFHGFPSEPSTPQQERVFEYGDALEWLLFDKLEIPSAHDPGGIKVIGDWWNRTTVLYEPKLELSILPSTSPIRDRQRVVSLESGIKGRIDGLADLSIARRALGHIVVIDAPEPTLVDAKSANGYSYDRACFDELGTAVFSREYVISMNLYMAALHREGVPVNRTVLIYMNKEHGPMMFRLVPYSQTMVDEGLDRLATAEQKAEPFPDWEWQHGQPIPLRCSYCEFKMACGEVRGLPLQAPIFVKGKPKWMVP